VVGGAEKYPELYARYKQDVIEPRRAVIREVLRRGVETGELRADLDIEAGISMLTGSLSTKTPQETFPEGYAETVVDLLLTGIGAPS
jgi:hypothetical protein